jgi:hypothetical protein
MRPSTSRRKLAVSPTSSDILAWPSSTEAFEPNGGNKVAGVDGRWKRQASTMSLIALLN